MRMKESYVREWVLSLSLVCLFSLAAFGQSAPQYSMYMLNRYQFNPAYAGMDASLSINGVYRSQWIDIPGNPEQTHFNAHMPLYILNGAAGIAFTHETIGAEGTLNASVSYNYVYDTDFGLFSAGASVGILQKSLDGSLIRTPDGEYEGTTIFHNDPTLPITLVRSATPVFGAGVYYAGLDFEAGVAVTEITPGTLELEGVRFKGKAAITLFGEYFIESLPEVSIYPTILVRSDLVQTQTELSVRAVYQEFLTGGLGVRGYSQNTIDAMTALVGLRLSENLTFAYAFDFTLSALNQVSRGSHEVMLRYNLNKIIGAGLPPPVIYNPRY